MTRNTMDDFYIATQIMTIYLDFLRSRVTEQEDITHLVCSQVVSKLSSIESINYMQKQIDYHDESTKYLHHIIMQIQQQLFDINDKYVLSYPVFSKENFQKNLKSHQKLIIDIFTKLSE